MIKCKGCGKTPDKIHEYIESAKEWKMTPEQYVIEEEGTYNKETGLFWCTTCYCALGMPLGLA